MERSRGVFILRLFWRAGLWLSHFLGKSGLWKSAVHQPLLNHGFGSRAGAAGPECSFVSVWRPAPSLGLAGYGQCPGTEGRVLGKGEHPQRTPCFSACGTLAWDCGGGERDLSQSAKGISLGAPSGRRRKGEGGRQCGSPGQPRGLCGQGLAPSLSQAYSFIFV